MKYTIDDIVKFAEDAMEEKEKANFEQVLALDPTLREKVQEYYQLRRTLHMGLEDDPEKEALKDTLSELNQQYFKEKGKVISIRKVLMRAVPVAAAAVIILFVWAPWKSNLYNQYAGIEMPGMAERGTNADSIKILAEEAFNKKDFSAAAGYLSVVHSEDANDALTSFYYGVSLMQTDSLTKSRAILNNVFQGESIYKYESAFYIALTYLKEKDNKNAKEWLEKIPSDAASYQKAVKLLHKIK